MIIFLRIFFSGLLIWMSYVLIATSRESDLFTTWDSLGKLPWMQATLWDLYANLLVIYLWILYKEKQLSCKLVWLPLLICLGSIGSCLYVLIQLFRTSPQDGLKELLGRQNG